MKHINKLTSIAFTWYSTANGGAEESTIQLCKKLAERYQLKIYFVACDIMSCLTSESNEFFRMIICKSVKEYVATVSALLKENHGNLFLFSSHRTFNIDLPIANNFNIKTGIIFRAIPIENESFRVLKAKDDKELTLINAKDLNWELISKSDIVIGVSKYCAKSISNFIPMAKNVTCIYNGLDRSYFNAVKSNIRTLNNFVIVSRLEKWKNIEIGIASFMRLNKKYPQTKLKIFGTGSHAQMLELKVRELGMQSEISFMGHQPKMVQHYQEADCLLHLSNMESFGRVVVEAGANGLLTIAPQSAGTGELIINGHSGLTFIPNDENDCYEVMESAILMPNDKLNKIRKMAFYRASDLFNIYRTVEEYIGVANYAIAI